MSENIVEWFKTIYKQKNVITEEFKEKITQNAGILMETDKTLIFLPLRVKHIEIFKILYDEIKNVPGILELVDRRNNDGRLLAWLCYLNLNDLLNECFDNIERKTFNIKESNGLSPLLYMIINARSNVDTNNILIRFLEKYHNEQQLGKELLLCVDELTFNNVLIPPNFDLLNEIIDIYKDDEGKRLDFTVKGLITKNTVFTCIFDNEHIDNKYLLNKIIDINTNILLNDNKYDNPFFTAIYKNNDAVFEGILKKYPEKINELINDSKFLWYIIYVYRQKEIYKDAEILRICFDKIVVKPQLNIELLCCIDGYIKIKGQYLHPNIALLKDIINLYEKSNNVLIYDSILNSEILYDKTKYNVSELRDINLIFDIILQNDKAFKHTKIFMNAIKFNNEKILDILIIKNPENIVEWFKIIYDQKKLITKYISDKIKQYAETLMSKNKTLIFLPLRADNIDIFRILYDKIKNVPGILEIENGDGTLLTWLCGLNLNDLLHKCFDNIKKDNFNTKESSGDTPLLYMIKHARRNLDTNNILLRYLEKYHKEQRLGKELLSCVDVLTYNKVPVPPNFELLNKIINMYRCDMEKQPDKLLNFNYTDLKTKNTVFTYIFDNQQVVDINLLYNIIDINTDILLNDNKYDNPFFTAIYKNNDAVFEGILKKYPEKINELINSKNFLASIIFVYRQKEIYKNENILKLCFDKIKVKPKLDIELLQCINDTIKIEDKYLHPNIALLKDIIDLYKGDEHLIVYDSILNSEILYDKEKYDVSELRDINLIFEKILENDKAFKHTNILMNVIKFSNRDIFNKIIKNPKNIKPLIDKSKPLKLLLICLQNERYYLEQLFKLLIQEIDSRIIDEIILLFHSNMNVKYLIDQLGIDQPKIDCIYNKIITRSSHINLETINSSYKIPNYELIKYLWDNSDRNQEKFEYVNSKTHDKYITEFGCLKNNGGSSIMKEFIDLGMCETRPVENTDQVYMSKLAWAKEHIANPDNILAKTGIRFEHLKHSIKICNYIFYCYDYTTCKIICIGTLLNPRDDKSYELDALCVDSKYPGLGTNFMNYIKKITKQLNQYESTKIKLSAIPRYETVRFYKDKAGFDFTDKDKHGKAILNERLYEMDVTYKKYLKYKAKYMNLRKKLLT